MGNFYHEGARKRALLLYKPLFLVSYITKKHSQSSANHFVLLINILQRVIKVLITKDGMSGRKGTFISEGQKEAIKKSGRSLYATAKVAGLSYPTINLVYNGKRAMSFETAFKLAEASGLTIEKFKSL